MANASPLRFDKNLFTGLEGQLAGVEYRQIVVTEMEVKLSQNAS